MLHIRLQHLLQIVSECACHDAVSFIQGAPGAKSSAQIAHWPRPFRSCASRRASLYSGLVGCIAEVLPWVTGRVSLGARTLAPKLLLPVLQLPRILLREASHRDGARRARRKL